MDGYFLRTAKHDRARRDVTAGYHHSALQHSSNSDQRRDSLAAAHIMHAAAACT